MYQNKVTKIAHPKLIFLARIGKNEV
jgi:hypothetical protein